MSPEAAARARKIEIENEKAEIDLAKMPREVISIKKAFELVRKDYTAIRCRILAIPKFDDVRTLAFVLAHCPFALASTD